MEIIDYDKLNEKKLIAFQRQLRILMESMEKDTISSIQALLTAKSMRPVEGRAGQLVTSETIKSLKEKMNNTRKKIADVHQKFPEVLAEIQLALPQKKLFKKVG